MASSFDAIESEDVERSMERATVSPPPTESGKDHKLYPRVAVTVRHTVISHELPQSCRVGHKLRVIKIRVGQKIRTVRKSSSDIRYCKPKILEESPGITKTLD